MNTDHFIRCCYVEWSLQCHIFQVKRACANTYKFSIQRLLNFKDWNVKIWWIDEIKTLEILRVESKPSIRIGLRLMGFLHGLWHLTIPLALSSKLFSKSQYIYLVLETLNNCNSTKGIRRLSEVPIFINSIYFYSVGINAFVYFQFLEDIQVFSSLFFSRIIDWLTRLV